MDFRIVKTRNAIKAAFYEERRLFPLESVRVVAICKRASINKSTFYKHYTDVFDLSDALENEMIESIFCSMNHVDALFSDTELFMKDILNAVENHHEEVLVLFNGRLEAFATKMEQRLKKVYENVDSSMEKDAFLSFVIGGSSHVFLSCYYGNKSTEGARVALAAAIGAMLGSPTVQRFLQE